MDKKKNEPEINTENKESNKIPWEMTMMIGSLIIAGILFALKIVGVF
jgi:hypothetical protein